VNGNESEIWFWNRIAMYKVNNGAASEWYSYETRNVDFYDDKHYSLEYSYSLEQSNPHEDAYSYIPPNGKRI
jgi:hypothetical protein